MPFPAKLLPATLTAQIDDFVAMKVKTSMVENLVIACHDCNSSKSNRLASVSIFNRMLRRNAVGSDFWEGCPEEIVNLDERIDRWVRHYYQASEQLSTGWMPERIA